MPLIDVTSPAGSITGPAREAATEALTCALLRAEGAADTDLLRQLIWVYWNDIPVDSIGVGGRLPQKPVHRVFITMPDGTGLHGPSGYAAARRRQLVHDVTEAILGAEGGEYSDLDSARVYCILREVPDGYWGALGTTFRLEEMAAIAEGNSDDDQTVARVDDAIERFTAGTGTP